MSVGLCRGCSQPKVAGQGTGPKTQKTRWRTVHRVPGYYLSASSMSVSQGSPAASGNMQGFREIKDTYKICRQGDGRSRRALRLSIVRHRKDEQDDCDPSRIDDELRHSVTIFAAGTTPPY